MADSQNPDQGNRSLFGLATTADLEATERRLTQLIEKVITMAQKADKAAAAASVSVDDAIANLTAEVTAVEAVDESAEALINGIPALITAAVSKAIAAGATPEQLAAFDTLNSALAANASTLATAVTANTPAAS